MTDDEHRPPLDPTRTTHLDTAWDDEPTYTDQHVFDDDPAAPEDDGPALPPPRSVAPPRVMGNPSVPPPPVAAPPAASGPPAGPASSPPPGPTAAVPMKGGEAVELTPMPEVEPKIPRPPRAPTPPPPTRAKQSVPPAPPKPGMGMAPAPPKPVAQAPQPPAPPSAAQPTQSAQASAVPVPGDATTSTSQPAVRQPPGPFPAPLAASEVTNPSPASPPPAPFELLPASSSLPVSLGDHLGRRILLGGFAVPSWVLSAASVFAAAVFGGLSTALVFSALSSTPTTSAPPAASSAPTSAAANTADVPVVELAAAGDPVAMKQLEAKPVKDRDVDETIALASGSAVQRKAALGALASDLRRNPNLAEDPDVMKRLREATKDRELARDALRLLASLPGPTPVDVIYDIWVGTKGRTPTTELAEALVFTKEVRAKASPALAVALDLREAETCEQVKPVVMRAIEHGDRRSLRLLGKLTLRYGCGPGKVKDCWECLRGEDTITDAINAARKRPEPKL